MSLFKRTLFLTFVAVTAAVLTTVVTLRGQEQASNESAPPGKQLQREEIESQFPAAELEAPEPTDPEERARRRKKSARYDKHNFVNPHDGSGRGTETELVSEWDLGLPAIPSSRSDVIAVGNVTDARAYLSNDKTGIYSEFKVTVEEVLKNSAAAPLLVNDFICVERIGGAVRYPSKGKYLYRVAGQGMPLVGKRYVFFLKANELAQTFDVITAYESRGDKVFPLDSAQQFDAYKGMDWAIFVGVLRGAIARPGVEIK